MLVGRRPCPELLAVVAHRPEARAVVGGVLAQIVDHVVNVAERDAVAESLLRPEHRQQMALVFRRVGAPQVRLGDRGGPEMRVVENRPAVAGGDERRREVRLPDALRQPRAARTASGDLGHLGCHPRQLPDPIALGQRRQHWLVIAAAQQLDLVAPHERAQPFDEVRPLRSQPLQQRARVMERQADARMALEGLEHRQVGLAVDVGKHPAEVADRLVVMDRQGERDAGGHVGARDRRPRAGSAGLGGHRFVDRLRALAGSSTPAAGR